MFKNRFPLIIAALFVLLVSLAVVSPLSWAPESVDLSGTPGSVMIPATGANDLSDYHQRHAERQAGVEITIDTTDYFLRHPELRSK